MKQRQMNRLKFPPVSIDMELKTMDFNCNFFGTFKVSWMLYCDKFLCKFGVWISIITLFGACLQKKCAHSLQENISPTNPIMNYLHALIAVKLLT
jgi:hypothetical protein